MNISQATATPIRYSNRLSREQRIRVLALYEARHSNREISDLLGISMNQVKYTIQTGRISPGKSTGRPHKLSTEQEDELEVFVCRDKKTRQMSYLEQSIHFICGMLVKMPSGMLSGEEDTFATSPEVSLH
ncbi:hypothetical protein K3495_g10623 [Podosphaera aphanis]|nr:hypothetical protein K3495_g10623 [Podosphaera aphanis]